MTEPALAPEPPPEAERVLGSALPVLRRYADLLAGDGVTRGVIGPREAGRLWERHLLNCAVVADLLPQLATVLDLGSGAGLPGMVLAACRPDASVTLVEPLARRIQFLEVVVTELALANVTLQRARAEELAGRLTADVVTARAVAPLSRVLEIGWPLVGRGGQLLAFKGRRARAEVAEAESALTRIGARAEIVHCGAGVLDPPTTIVRVRR